MGCHAEARHRLNTQPGGLLTAEPSRTSHGEAAISASLMAPLIPPRGWPGGREHGRTGPVRRLPVAAAPEVPVVPDDVVYGFGWIDESSRVADRAMTATWGWQPGDRMTLTAAAGVVIARRDPAGLVTIPASRTW
jgi:hypothetical protein